ncbi:MAG: CoB--CoM heterodisulfide reductase iron-sulfur subunit A family protein [Candidatus Aminicenantes bacterium]|nr:CoB--CoM heterodisulfide reductase iron-sulfur subunit A family protein [Candidatus Aminicenantes bacterium]
MNGQIGVYVCECGPNIKDKIDIDKVIEEISSLEDVKTIKRFPLLCSNDGKKFLEEEIEKEELTHLVIAACSPREHEQTFMAVCEKAGMNPYLCQLINIREQCAWMIPDKNQATAKAIQYIRAGIHRVHLQKPLEKKEIESTPDVLVIGGGISGLETSLSLAGKDRRVFLVEKTESLGGMAAKLSRVLPSQGSSLSFIEEKIEQALKNPHIEVFTSSEMSSIRGFLGNFEATITTSGSSTEVRKVRIGAVVVAAGFSLYDCRKDARYGYGTIENVVTALELEAMLSGNKVLMKNGKPPRSVALIHCVGRSELGYCSKVCCLYSIKLAQHLKDVMVDTDTIEMYADLCLPHKSDQEYFLAAKDRGVRFIRSEEEAKIKESAGQIEVAFSRDGKTESIAVDMVVLAPAMVPAEGTAELAGMLNIPIDRTGFFKEVHEILDPVSTPIEGVYIAGCAAGPKNISESIVQSQAASGKILSSLIPGKKIIPEVRVSEIREEFCTGCQTCLTVCFYGAISYDPVKNVSVVNEVICRGCGSCVGSCPSGAIRSKHFTYPQLYGEVLEALQ